MRQGRTLNLATLAGLALAGATGCHQHHYYGYATPGTALSQPMVVSGGPQVVSYGDVCDVPASPAGTVVTSPPASGPVVISGGPAAGAGPVVVSQPRGGLLSGRGFGSKSWRAADPEPKITVKAEGAYPAGTVVK